MMLTCDLLAWEERQEEDDRNIGDLFYIMGEVMPDLELNEVKVAQFISKLPQGVSERLKAA